MSACDVAIIGAGPYGLSVAAHLRAVNGLGVQIFGDPMSFWDRQMPVGMLLRSPWAGSHLSDPKGALTLDAYRQAQGNHFGAPIPLDRFIEYGTWVQEQVAPDVDRRVARLGLALHPVACRQQLPADAAVAGDVLVQRLCAEQRPPGRPDKGVPDRRPR